MLDLQAFRQLSECGRLLGMHQPFYRQQELMLMGLNSRGPRRLFAEVQESADVIAKLGQCRIVGGRDGRRRAHEIIISYYDMFSARLNERRDML